MRLSTLDGAVGLPVRLFPEPVVTAQVGYGRTRMSSYFFQQGGKAHRTTSFGLELRASIPRYVLLYTTAGALDGAVLACAAVPGLNGPTLDVCGRVAGGALWWKVGEVVWVPRVEAGSRLAVDVAVHPDVSIRGSVDLALSTPHITLSYPGQTWTTPTLAVTPALQLRWTIGASWDRWGHGY